MLKTRIKTLLVLAVGFSAIVLIAVTGDRYLLTDFIAPAPVVFSYGRDLKKKEDRLSFVLTHEDGSTSKIKFGRDFFQKIDGSHHYKLLYHYFMQSEAITKNPKYPRFLNSYICKSYSAASKVNTIQIYTRKENLLTHDCP